MYRNLSVFVLCCAILTGFLSIGDYGMSWDETSRFRGGDAKLEYYDALLSGETRSDLGLDRYPGLFDFSLAYIHRSFPDLGTRSQKGHFLSFLFGVAGLVAAWRLTAKMGGERAGFFGLLFLITYPRYYGHMFMNPKDIPLAGTYLLGVWALAETLSRMPKPPIRFVIFLGFAAGLAMSVRIAGFLILFYFGIIVGLFLLSNYAASWCQTRQIRWIDLKNDLVRWLCLGVLSGLVAFVILFIFWPALHQNPFAHVSHTAGSVQNFDWNGYVLMSGEFWKASELPSYYLPYWMFVATPEYLLVLLLVGLCFCAHYLLRIVRKEQNLNLNQGKLWMHFAVLISGLFPIFYILATDPTLYDGLRHFLFTIPPLICLCALVFERILQWLEHAPERKRLVKWFQFGTLGAVLIVVLQMVALHPYQYVYFNQLSGGLTAASGRDETDYWGLSQKEAAEWLNEYIKTIDLSGEKVFKIYMVHSQWMLEDVLNSNFVITTDRAKADFFVSLTRMNFHLKCPESTILHIVERQGVPLTFITQIPDLTGEGLSK